MKKITFSILMVLLLSTLGWQAQAQYCSLTFSFVEPITNVEFAGIANRTAQSGGPGYEDFTAMVGNVSPGGTYSITLEGNTSGNFTNRFYVFIDWNQNEILDDPGEVYIINPFLVNSNGNDGKLIIDDIDVPAGALSGNTRMRVKKTYGTSTYDDPCVRGSSFGQAEDYTINVMPVVGNPPTIVCPGDITASNNPGLCSAVVNFSDAVAIDPEDGVLPTTQTAGPASGDAFPVGTTTVEFSATDSDGNTVTCSFDVTVTDDEAPVVACQPITVDLDGASGTVSITAADIDNGSTDNCGIASMSLDVSSFDCSMVGDNTVTLTVVDNAGNSASCTAVVTVQDVTAPEVFCVGGFGIFSESEDFEGSTVPSGWTTNVISGGQDWTFGSGAMPGGPDFPTNAAIFDDDAAGSGADNVAELISPVYDLTGATTATLNFDYSLQDFAGSGLLRVEVYDGAAWQEVFLADDQDIPPTNSGDIDVFAYANAAFQVKFTFDDEGDWGWGAGVDNFLLEYQAASGGGLDVYLDADGNASISPNDLVSGVIEACGYTISAAGTGGGTVGSLTTLFASGNNGSPGGAVYFDVTVGPADIEITDIDLNTADPGSFTVDVYTLVGTYVGNETNAAAWGAPAAVGSGTGAGQNAPSNAVLDNPITLTANTTYGMALVFDSTHSHYYTNGNGSNQNFSNSDLSMSLGGASNTPFSTPIFSPRVFNGTLHYIGGPGSGVDFTCADLGENIIEVTVTDDSGNATTCMAVVNVIDNIAPVITCAGTPGPVAVVEDFESNTIPNGWTSEINVGNTDWTFGSGDMPTGGDFPTKAAIFDDDAAGSGNVNKATLYSPTYNIVGSTTASISFDYAFQEFGGGILTAEVYDGTAWQEVFSVNSNTDPTNTGSIDVASYINSAFQVRFVYDDEGAWSWGAGVDNFTLNYEVTSPTAIDIVLGDDGTAIVDPYMLIRDMEEACGISSVAVDVAQVTCADIGATIDVTVFVSDESGNLASCTTMINVVDQTAPVITCPVDQTQDPGPGNLFYILPDYFATGEASAVDNCTAPVTITSQDPVAGTALPDGTHTITLTAEDEYGNVSTCSFVLTVESIIGIDENNLDAGVTLYPNPAKDVVNLVNKANIALNTLTVYDINGKLVINADLRNMQGEKSIDVSSLASGVYVVQITGDNASTVKRLIKE